MNRVARLFAYWSLAFFFAFPVYLPAAASAQAGAQSGFDLAAFGTSLAIEFAPRYPAQNEPVHLTLRAQGIDLSRSTVVWRAGGKIIAQGAGVDSTDVVSGALGSETAVSAEVTSADGASYSARAIIAPSEVDLLVGSNSYTPPFYRGRALPSAVADIVVAARSSLVRVSGSVIPDSDIIYTWRVDGEVLGSASGRGRSSLVIPITHLFGAGAVEVTAVSSDGTRSVGASVALPLVEPVLVLYQDHPLYGILYQNALGPSARISETEMGFAATPYFARATSPNDPALSYEWTVNDTRVAPNVSSPSSITINAENSTGVAAISLEVTHANDFFMDARGAWSVTLSSGGPAQNPFRAEQ